MNSFLIVLTVFFIVIVLLHSPTTNSCMPDDADTNIKVGSNTYVCLNIAPLVWISQGSFNNSGLFARSANSVKADTVSSLNVKQTWTSEDYNDDIPMQTFGIYPSPGSGLGVSVESMGILSYQRAYRLTLNNSQQVTFPLMMAIITVHKGTVTSIAWDDDECSWCSSTSCAANTYDYSGHIQNSGGRACFIPDHTCNLNKFKNGTIVSNLCQLTVFVVWTGTDASGRYFKSAATR